MSNCGRDPGDEPESVTVTVRSVDGGLMEYSAPRPLLRRLRALRRDGLDGKALVHALLTDDWGAPPTSITISGTTVDGTPVREIIVYE